MKIRNKQAGVALLTAVFFSAIFAIFVAGMAYLAGGHYEYAHKTSDYTVSLEAANAGINYEVQYISQNQFATGFTAPTQAAPLTGSVPGFPNATFKAWITDMNGGAWDPSKKDAMFYATGTFNGITRAVEAHGMGGDGLFNDYTIFGVDSVTFNGSGSQVIGSVGTDGTITSSSSGSDAVSGTIYLDGSGAGGVTGDNVVSNPDPVLWPTVTQIADATFPGPPSGFDWLVNHNDNAKARAYTISPFWTTDASGNMSPIAPSPANTTSSPITNDTISLSGKNALILPPGDYYLTSLSLNGNYAWLVIDNAGLSTGTGPGLVRIWINGSGGDHLSNPLFYTANDPSLFRMYYNSPGTFQIDGNTASGGAFYGYTGTGNTTFSITGGSYTYASIIADNVTVSGNSTVEFPSGEPGNGQDLYWLWFGLKDGYTEIPATGGKTFPDGTSN